MSELGPLSNHIHEVAPLVKSRKLSPVELTRAAIDHAERMQPVLKSFITLTPELALREAQKLEAMLMRGEWLGPLHGIPVGLKDMLLTKGVLTTDGSKALEDYVPDEDAPVVSRIKAAGAVILGKENMHEIGAGFQSDNPWFGRVRNPWDTERYAGGSSGGSAANVAAYVTFASLGTDGGGSVRQPSAVCGIVGMKATYGRVSNLGCLEGVDPANFHVGPHTRCVKDNAIVLGAIAGDEPLDPSTVPVPVDDYEGALDRDIRGLVMGIPENHFYDPLDTEVAGAVSRAIAVLEEFGVEARPVEMKRLELLPLVQAASRANSIRGVRGPTTGGAGELQPGGAAQDAERPVRAGQGPREGAAGAAAYPEGVAEGDGRGGLPGHAHHTGAGVAVRRHVHHAGRLGGQGRLARRLERGDGAQHQPRKSRRRARAVGAVRLFERGDAHRAATLRAGRGKRVCCTGWRTATSAARARGGRRRQRSRPHLRRPALCPAGRGGAPWR